MVKRFAGIHNHEVLDIAMYSQTNQIPRQWKNCICGRRQGGTRLGCHHWTTAQRIYRPQRSRLIFDKRVNTVAWNPDDNMVISGSADGTVRFWDMRQKKPTETAVDRINSDMQSLQRCSYPFIGQRGPHLHWMFRWICETFRYSSRRSSFG